MAQTNAPGSQSAPGAIRIRFMSKKITGILLVGLMACAQPQASEPVAALHDLFEREWAVRLAEFPMFATYVGVQDYNDRLTDVSVAAQKRRALLSLGFLDELNAIDRAALPRQEQVNYSLFKRQLENDLAGFEYGEWQIPLNADSGFHTAYARLPVEVPLQSIADYENYLARLKAWPTHVAQQIDNMRIGLGRGMTLPRVVLEGIESGIAPHVVSQAEHSVFYAPFERLPAHFSEQEKARLTAAGKTAILNSVVPGYQAFLEFMTEEYIPGARATLGATELPNGAAYYTQRIKYFTTLSLDAAAIHQIGLAEVERIRKDMDAVIEKVGFEGNFASFLQFLRTDPRFYAATPQELLKEAAFIAKTMDGKLPSLFGALPRLPYGIAPVPEHIAPKYTAGRYVPPAQGSGQPGWDWVNTHKLESRPLYALPALTLHEAVPGHHLQFALALEQGEQPPFRRFDYISAFGEGWGLYSEWLGIEAGIYDDPYDEFGRLTYEMWRACRLVVDTGLHAMGWSRQQAMDFLAGNTALSLHEVATETDRYISWPAQALSYKLGELKIRELRQLAEAELGADFDIREFHDAVLVNGSVTLPLLEESVRDFITARSAAN